MAGCVYGRGGMHGREGCMAGGGHGRGYAWQGGMHDRGWAWQGVCMTGRGMHIRHGRGCAWQLCMHDEGTCMAGGGLWHGKRPLKRAVRILLE